MLQGGDSETGMVFGMSSGLLTTTGGGLPEVIPLQALSLETTARRSPKLVLGGVVGSRRTDEQ
jgi:hypothetical protein